MSEAAAPAQANPEAASPTDVPSSVTEPTSVTPPVTETPAATPEAEKPTATADPKEEAPAVPETYSLKLPDGSPLDASHLESVSTYAKENGLTEAQAQALVNRDHAAFASQQEAIQQKMNEWVEELKADKTIGGAAFTESVALADRALKAFAPPEFVKELKETGLGNHPGLVRAFIQVGKAMADDTLVTPGAGAPTGGELRHADILYPSLQPKT